MGEKVFTIAEVNKKIPFLMTLIARIKKKKEKMTRMHENILTAELIAGSDEHATQQSKLLEELILSVAMDLKEIEEEGCIVRDLDQGIIDFYCEHAGKRICLNWVLPEKKIQFWHPQDVSHLERRPLSELTDD